MELRILNLIKIPKTQTIIRNIKLISFQKQTFLTFTLDLVTKTKVLASKSELRIYLPIERNFSLEPMGSKKRNLSGPQKK